MTGFRGLVSRIFRLPDSAEKEALRQRLHLDFRQRCLLFKQLIAANNRALESMSDMEELLQGTVSFDLLQVRGLCAQATANVFKMIRCLEGMTEGGQRTLYARLREIQQEIGRHVEGGRAPVPGPLVLPLGEVGVSDVGEVGPKMANLGELGRMGLSIPVGFVVTASGFRSFFEESGLFETVERLTRELPAGRLDEQHALSAAIRERILDSELPAELRERIEEQCAGLVRELGGDIRLAMRSSAQGEDLPGASFAGQYHTELGVRPDHAVRVYKEIVASKYNVTAMNYRLSRGIPDERMAMCVGALVMIDSRCGGVAYSMDPVAQGEKRLAVYATFGLPSTVVDGEDQADQYLLTRDGDPRLLEAKVPRKSCFAELDPAEGTRKTELPPSEQESRVLDDAPLAELAREVLAIEKRFGSPQDVEWTFDKQGRLIFLQSRPLTDLPSEEPEAEVDGVQPILAGGAPASSGAASGTVHVVRKNAEALSFQQGSVLVVSRAQPQWASLLSKAAAVVAETGSAAGHLANVAREYGIPAVFGLDGAIAVLEEKGVITVDGTHGRVFAGRVAQLVERAGEERSRPMVGSPVYVKLEGAAQHIVPLHLLDPESPSFSPEHCRTLHDITRYCHEKSVGQLFATDKGPMRNRLAKQLRYKGAPSMYWIIDLGGAFAGHPKGKYIEFEHIESRPFHVLWEGITAKQWWGPPALDVKGFASIIGQAAANRDLEPALASSFEVRNYFMLSQDFISLQARMGFHFCTLEAFFGEVEEENYASFRFKGGAADMERRILRAEMVADMLEEYGFRTELRQDSLLARVEGLPREELEQKFRILGFVMIHTKQLDMVMKNRASAQAHENRIRTDLEQLIERDWKSEADV